MCLYLCYYTCGVCRFRLKLLWQPQCQNTPSAGHAQSWQQQGKFWNAWKDSSPAQLFCPTGISFSRALCSLSGTQLDNWHLMNQKLLKISLLTLPSWTLPVRSVSPATNVLTEADHFCQSWRLFHRCEHLATRSKTEKSSCVLLKLECSQNSLLSMASLRHRWLKSWSQLFSEQTNKNSISYLLPDFNCRVWSWCYFTDTVHGIHFHKVY